MSEKVTASPAVATGGPLFTVIALCYNHARFLHECLQSIAEQTYQDFELIVTDDASRDESPVLVEKWLKENRPEARFIRHERNRGLCATLNEVLTVARGRYVAMVATDDRWLPNRLAAHAAEVARDMAPAAVLFSDARVMDETGRITFPSFIEQHRQGYVPRSGLLFSDLVDANFIPAMCVSISTAALRRVGGYDERLSYEDYDMWLRLSALGEPFRYVEGALADYRIVSTSIVRTTFRQDNPNHRFTELAIFRKCLATTLLTPTQRVRLLGRVEAAAYSLYLSDDPRASDCLIYAGRVLRRPRLIGLGLLAAIGIRRSSLKRMLAWTGLSR